MLDKIKRSNKIYPIYYGLSSDLIFWIAINTLFLSTVKNLSAFEINSLTTISTIISIIIYIFSYKIIKKIGNIKSIRFANLLLLFAALLLTFSNKYIFLLIGEIFYEISFIFKSVDSVILIRNLKYLNKEDEYLKIQNQATTIYSFVTMVIALISGLIFNVNPYLPMLICITICFINLILSMFIYEVDIKETKKIQNKKINISKIILYIIITYGLLYGSIVIGQDNAKLFIQYKLSETFSIDKTVIYLTFIVFISRIVRLISNLNFMKFFKIIGDKFIVFAQISLLVAFDLFIVGNFINNIVIGAVVMSLGFFIFLALRDPVEIYLRTVLMNNAKIEEQERSILYFNFSRKVVRFLLSLIVTAILFKLKMVFVFCGIAIMLIIYIPIVLNLYNLIIEKVKE